LNSVEGEEREGYYEHAVGEEESIPVDPPDDPRTPGSVFQMSAEDIAKLNVADLQSKLKSLGQDICGLKADLATRLNLYREQGLTYLSQNDINDPDRANLENINDPDRENLENSGFPPSDSNGK